MVRIGKEIAMKRNASDSPAISGIIENRVKLYLAELE